MEGEAKKEIPYEATSDGAWAAAVDGWPWVRRDDFERSKTGKCPRCAHDMGLTEEVWVGAAMADAVARDSKRFAACNCSVEHPGAPKGQSGCGASGEIRRPE
jgi:hypothetical protein